MLTVVHDQLEESPKTAASVAGGWMLVLSGLKTVLETGEPLAGCHRHNGCGISGGARPESASTADLEPSCGWTTA